MPFTISFMEVFDAVIIVLALGFIFKDFFRAPLTYADPVAHYYKKAKSMIDWDDFKFAALVTAPAVILHELAHKGVASAFGMTAVFNAAYLWLGIGIVLKLMKTNFIFFVPAFVSIAGTSSHLEYSLVAFAGPAMNLIIFIAMVLILRFSKITNKKYLAAMILTKKVNLFLFIFNMLPIPGFDGSKVFAGLFALL